MEFNGRTEQRFRGFLMDEELLYHVPYRALCKYRLDRGQARYVCTDPAASPVAVDRILAPVLSPAIIGLDARRLDSVLRALAVGTPLDPVVLVQHSSASHFTLAAGLHRFYAARASRLIQVPAVFVART
jgi:hypothetical protein